MADDGNSTNNLLTACEEENLKSSEEKISVKRKSEDESAPPSKKPNTISVELEYKVPSETVSEALSAKSKRVSKSRCNDLINSDSKNLEVEAPKNDDSAKNAETKNQDDEFSPSVDMMINDYDDERTLDEEEALGELEDPQSELTTLQKEGDMPLADLMAKYGIKENMDKYESSEEESESGSEVDEKPQPSELEQLYEDAPVRNASSRISIRPSRYASRQESEEEEDSPEEEEKKKIIMVGSDYQAQVPKGLCKYDDSLPYENEDKLVWDPVSLSPKEIEEYLLKSQEPILNDAQSVASIPRGAHTRDDEQSLLLLLQCGYNVEEALRRRRLNAVPPDSMSVWSEEECKNFESGLRTLGKDFRQIQLYKVKTRSVGEIVQFYYLWKKTERHDIFANKARLEKKKYALHPGITDYMDRYLEEQDGPCSRDRSLSPGVHNNAAGETSNNSTGEPSVEKKEIKKEPEPTTSEKVESTSNDKMLLNPIKKEQLDPS